MHKNIVQILAILNSNTVSLHLTNDNSILTKVINQITINTANYTQIQQL